MKEFFKSTGIKILFSVLLVVIMLSLFTNHLQNNFLSNAVNATTYGLSSVTAAATADNRSNMGYEELLSKYNELKDENTELRAKLVDYYDTKTENARLWKFYDLKKENPEYTLVPSTVLRRDANDDFYSFTIDKGTSSNVQKGDAVVTPQGIIGWIKNADVNTSKVITLLSTQTRISAINNKSSDTGIITGSAKLSEKNQTTFSKLKSDNKVEKGDIITTTGISGIYPKGLVVGEVVDVCYDTYDTSYYAVVEPYDEIKTLKEVAVITNFTGQGEILKSGEADE